MSQQLKRRVSYTKMMMKNVSNRSSKLEIREFSICRANRNFKLETEVTERTWDFKTYEVTRLWKELARLLSVWTHRYHSWFYSIWRTRVELTIQNETTLTTAQVALFLPAVRTEKVSSKHSSKLLNPNQAAWGLDKLLAKEFQLFHWVDPWELFQQWTQNVRKQLGLLHSQRCQSRELGPTATG
jgi:hypothetical protein